ncbi:hypothetical protein [Gandjariella thermophila]|uniref:Uncharacterized protein n=1 Tax=Gandjariella thermophila TaxID=1931992 RepID=A0A4D4J787_9PSEU|nr:hypothetical protein [Gandjariella thermophila]GDY31364.1 hypothetical protein GTS_29970 [Gandjariella thermophila]
MQRWALVVAESADRSVTRRRILVVLAVLGSLGGLLLVGRVVASDPVAYHAAVRPFADGWDGDEDRQLALAVSAARDEARRRGDLSGVPAAVGRSGVDVLAAEVRRPTASDGTVLLRVRLRVHDADDPARPEQVRCREVRITGAAADDVASRRTACPPAEQAPADRSDPAG